MNTAKIYQDSEGNDCSIYQMVRREPDWAANRLQEGERAIEQLVEANILLTECYEYFEWSNNASKEDCIKQDSLSSAIAKHLNL